MKEFDINLDLPIKARYKEVFEYYGRFIDYLVFSERQTSVIRNLLYLASQGQDSDFQEHMEAFAELSGLSIFDIIALNYSYELTACTTILLRDSSNNILMGRNLDYFTYYAMVNMLFKANYYQNNTLLFQAITLPGMLGSINSIKKGEYITSINLRTGSSKAMNLVRIRLGKISPLYALYKVGINSNTYNLAENYLSNIELTVNAYFSIAGTKEGVLITRNPDSVFAKEIISERSNDWFIVITNTDRHLPDPENDYRRVPCEKRLSKIGIEQVNRDNLFSDVIALYPSNNLLTCYSFVADMKNNYLDLRLWNL